MVEPDRQPGLRAQRAPAHDARRPPLGVLHHRYPARLREKGDMHVFMTVTYKASDSIHDRSCSKHEPTMEVSNHVAHWPW